MKHVSPAETLMQAVRQTRLSGAVLSGCARAAETSVLALLGLALNAGESGPAFEASDVLVYVAVALIASVTLNASGAYRLDALRAPTSLPRVMLIWCGAILSFMALDFLLRLDGRFSRDFMQLWLVGGVAFLIVERVLLGLWTRRMTRLGRLDRYAVIVGGGPMAEMLLETLSRPPLNDLRILGLFDDRGDERSPDMIAGYPKLGSVDDLVAFARNARIDQVIFALPVSAEGRILSMLRKLWVLPVDIRLAAHANRLRFRPRAYSFIGAAPMLDLLDKPLSDSALFFKAAFDRVAGALLLLACAPLMGAIALAVRLTSRGPVIFRQERLGFNNERITIYKFRTLYADQCDPVARKQVTRGDPRVTPLGRFLRRASLDELPQFINVVKGDLSLVGPRPHALNSRVANREYHMAVDGYFARHRVKPGVTGWAQINGWRGETDTLEKIQRRVEHDLDYIENWSMLLDLYILVLTPFSLVFGANAY
ncbi:undecaprenyl-phosphate glucose phosphotransferase [Rhodoblastus sphagnicola]|uniref:Undecaprenyl-phosphate glucose phosphotransferase n=1 Tax=Rhodoblastus sphagnicola TaxID=333368 RepID=A0A2S6ND16_9HYPH|nr:undecaprenyl-phosphate glucose phosphotransferase [Rhodoblastus sphagnicola]MBB4198073.1 Undecaprenyl-phosphate glucose phosphotransferase [Rhodoblastus sphagnicola]PPQ32502.1 undecaprenyl-phosphate glucose phosphotransferase [Rhodoblastus sphagnicola]